MVDMLGKYYDDAVSLDHLQCNCSKMKLIEGEIQFINSPKKTFNTSYKITLQNKYINNDVKKGCNKY